MLGVDGGEYGGDLRVGERDVEGGEAVTLVGDLGALLGWDGEVWGRVEVAGAWTGRQGQGGKICGGSVHHAQ